MRAFLAVLFLFLAGVVVTNGFELKYGNNLDGPKPQPRIISGLLAKEGQFKYQVGLYIKKTSSNTMCAGSLIAPNWIITSAACIEGATAVYAFMGSTDILSGTAVPVYQAIIHGKWDPQTNENNICLLRIRTLKSTPNIVPVALPPLGDSETSYVNDEAIVSGWGLTKDDGEPADQLQYGRVKIVPNSVCTRTFTSDKVKSTNICTQGQMGVAVCRGDGGGPLVTESGILIGINSFSAADGCNLGFPDAFTRISSYRSWINLVDDLEFHSPDLSEINLAIARLKSNKTASSDGLQEELFKYGVDDLVRSIHQVFNKIWYARQVEP